MRFLTNDDPAVDAIYSALSTVEDPELGLDIVSLGLVYAVGRDGDHVRVVHTLTSMGCPLGPVIERDIDGAVRALDGVDSVDVELVFDPPWSPDLMSDDARFLLGVYG